MFSYLLIFVGVNTISSIELVDQGIAEYMNKLGDMIPVLMPIIGIVIYYISYRISLRIWQKKDFK